LYGAIPGVHTAVALRTVARCARVCRLLLTSVPRCVWDRYKYASLSQGPQLVPSALTRV
jgi:hypothetical protein